MDAAVAAHLLVQLVGQVADVVENRCVCRGILHDLLHAERMLWTCVSRHMPNSIGTKRRIKNENYHSPNVQQMTTLGPTTEAPNCSR